MARSKRYYIPKQIWHITHRCHKQEFLLKFAKDKYRWLHWLYVAKKKYGTTILNYTITSNHIHLLVMDDKDRMTIPKTIQLIAGRCAQEYNIRKKRKGAFWEDRYHATAVQSGRHLLRCLVYIDLNMVRAGVLEHPKLWDFSGYNEIQKPKRKYILINHDKLIELTGCGSLNSLTELHRDLVEKFIKEENYKRQTRWTQSVAVGDKDFVVDIKKKLGFRADGRNIVSNNDEYTLREDQAPYNALFGVKKAGIEVKNSHFWI
ncbi:MAG: transposase [Desulfobacterales bacterium]|nr:transposase [Desulfobacterales bacterium]